MPQLAGLLRELKEGNEKCCIARPDPSSLETLERLPFVGKKFPLQNLIYCVNFPIYEGNAA